MDYIISEVSKVKDVILAKACHESDPIAMENIQQAELTKEIYNVIHNFINQIVNVDFHQEHPGKLILLGGIQINMPKPMDDYFQPLLFEIRSLNKETIDLMNIFDKNLNPTGNVNATSIPEELPSTSHLRSEHH